MKIDNNMQTVSSDTINAEVKPNIIHDEGTNGPTLMPIQVRPVTLGGPRGSQNDLEKVKHRMQV